VYSTSSATRGTPFLAGRFVGGTCDNPLHVAERTVTRSTVGLVDRMGVLVGAYAVFGVGGPPARAAANVVFVEAKSAYDSQSPKTALAVCPPGKPTHATPIRRDNDLGTGRSTLHPAGALRLDDRNLRPVIPEGAGPCQPSGCDRFLLIPGSVRTNAGKGSGSRLDRRSTRAAGLALTPAPIGAESLRRER
jgi:hypothetical protein